MFLQHVGGDFFYECHLKGKAIKAMSRSWWVLSVEPIVELMGFEFWPIYGIWHTTTMPSFIACKQAKGSFFLYLCFERWLHSTSPPPFLWASMSSSPWFSHTHTHGVLQASNLPIAKRLVDDHHATQSLMLGDFSLTLLSPCCKCVWTKLRYINSTKKCIM